MKELCAEVLPGLALLSQALRCAKDVGQSPWEFGVGITRLRESGLSDSHIRWLIYRGLAEHRREVTHADHGLRQFAVEKNTSLHSNTCLIITVHGEQLLAELCSGQHRSEPNHQSNGPSVVVVGGNGAAVTPVWNRERHELLLGDRLVKRFRLPSPNQESILNAFEEEAWPDRIDDPLSPSAEIDPKRRLHDCIRSLNRNQATPLLRFHGDGTGQGVIWERAGT